MIDRYLETTHTLVENGAQRERKLRGTDPVNSAHRTELNQHESR